MRITQLHVAAMRGSLSARIAPSRGIDCPCSDMQTIEQWAPEQKLTQLSAPQFGPLCLKFSQPVVICLFFHHPHHDSGVTHGRPEQRD